MEVGGRTTGVANIFRDTAGVEEPIQDHRAQSLPGTRGWWDRK